MKRRTRRKYPENTRMIFNSKLGKTERHKLERTKRKREITRRESREHTVGTSFRDFFALYTKVANMCSFVTPKRKC